jgi:hypothetical protein
MPPQHVSVPPRRSNSQVRLTLANYVDAPALTSHEKCRLLSETRHACARRLRNRPGPAWRAPLSAAWVGHSSLTASAGLPSSSPNGLPTKVDVCPAPACPITTPPLSGHAASLLCAFRFLRPAVLFLHSSGWRSPPLDRFSRRLTLCELSPPAVTVGHDFARAPLQNRFTVQISFEVRLLQCPTPLVAPSPSCSPIAVPCNFNCSPPPSVVGPSSGSAPVRSMRIFSWRPSTRLLPMSPSWP